MIGGTPRCVLGRSPAEHATLPLTRTLPTQAVATANRSWLWLRHTCTGGCRWSHRLRGGWVTDRAGVPGAGKHHDHDLVTAASSHLRGGLSLRCRCDSKRLVRVRLLPLPARRIASQRDAVQLPQRLVAAAHQPSRGGESQRTENQRRRVAGRHHHRDQNRDVHHLDRLAGSLRAFGGLDAARHSAPIDEHDDLPLTRSSLMLQAATAAGLLDGYGLASRPATLFGVQNEPFRMVIEDVF